MGAGTHHQHAEPLRRGQPVAVATGEEGDAQVGGEGGQQHQVGRADVGDDDDQIGPLLPHRGHRLPQRGLIVAEGQPLHEGGHHDAGGGLETQADDPHLHPVDLADGVGLDVGGRLAGLHLLQVGGEEGEVHRLAVGGQHLLAEVEVVVPYGRRVVPHPVEDLHGGAALEPGGDGGAGPHIPSAEEEGGVRIRLVPLLTEAGHQLRCTADGVGPLLAGLQVAVLVGGVEKGHLADGGRR